MNVFLAGQRYDGLTDMAAPPDVMLELSDRARSPSIRAAVSIATVCCACGLLVFYHSYLRAYLAVVFGDVQLTVEDEVRDGPEAMAQATIAMDTSTHGSDRDRTAATRTGSTELLASANRAVEVRAGTTWFKLRIGTDIHGHDLAAYNQAGQPECEELCFRNASCLAFTWPGCQARRLPAVFTLHLCIQA